MPNKDVAPYTGAWIEICGYCRVGSCVYVAPYTGAWIEITTISCDFAVPRSLPTRERGLKSGKTVLVLGKTRRSLHGSVD